MSDLTTYSAAIAQMGSRALGAWSQIALTRLDCDDMRFPETELSFGKNQNKQHYFARFSTQGVQAGKSSVGSPVNAKARYTNNGLIFIQVFAPMFLSDGPTVGRQLAETMRDAFRGAPTDASVIYRNARIEEMSNDGTFFQYRVIVEYEFDELQ
jgi:hypothetical protein